MPVSRKLPAELQKTWTVTQLSRLVRDRDPGALKWLADVVAFAGGDMKKAAKLAGIARATIYGWQRFAPELAKLAQGPAAAARQNAAIGRAKLSRAFAALAREEKRRALRKESAQAE